MLTTHGRRFAGIAIICVALLGGVVSSSLPVRGAETAPVEVTIGVAAPAAILGLAQIASDRNLWPPNIHVTWTLMSAATINASLVTGKVPLVLGAPPQYDMSAYNAKAPVAWLAQWQDPPDFQMIAGPGIASVAALKGKVIAATTPNSSTAILADAALHLAGLSSSDYQILAMGDIAGDVAAFTSGKASAFVLPASTIQPVLLQVPGSKVVFDFYDGKIPWFSAGIVAYMPWVQQNQAATIAVLAALNKALHLVHSSRALAEPSIATFVGAKTPAAADLQFKYLIERSTNSLQPVKAGTLRSVYASVRLSNNGDGPPDSYASSLIDNTYVEKMLKQYR